MPEAAFPCDIAAVIPVREDRRSIFVVSWGDQVYLGTTDTDYDGPLDDPSCLPEDVDYILDAANAVTTGRLSRADITGMWAGLRPLLAPSREGTPPSERTADLSRRHTVRTSTDGMVTVTGGKLTTYRKMAEDTVDAAVGASAGKAGPCPTKTLRLRGAHRPAAAPAPEAGGAGAGPGAPTPRPPRVAAHLAGRYGTEPRRCWRWPTAGPTARPAGPGLPYLAAEAVYAVRRGDGPHGGRRARPAHPGLLPRRPGRGRRPPAGGRPHRPRARMGRPTGSPTRPRPTPTGSAPTWPGPASTPA